MKEHASINFHYDTDLSLKTHMPVTIPWSKICKPIQSSVGRSHTGFVARCFACVQSFSVYPYDIRRRGGKKNWGEKKKFPKATQSHSNRTQNGGEKSEGYGMFFLKGNILLMQKKCTRWSVPFPPYPFFFKTTKTTSTISYY